MLILELQKQATVETAGTNVLEANSPNYLFSQKLQMLNSNIYLCIKKIIPQGSKHKLSQTRKGPQGQAVTQRGSPHPHLRKAFVAPRGQAGERRGHTLGKTQVCREKMLLQSVLGYTLEFLKPVLIS